LLRVLLTVALCLPASAQWNRVVFSGKGESQDVPLPHSLRYFTASPVLRDDGEDLCVRCTPEGRAKSALEYSVRPVVRQVGSLAGYRILDVLYSGSKRNDRSQVEILWKSILVRVGPNRYKEIFHLQATGNVTSLKPSSIILSGNERVLATMDFDGGVGGGCWEGYWWFDRAGPHPLDLSRLEAAIQNRIPTNTNFSSRCSNLDLKSQSVRSGVQKAHPECHTCDWVGEVTAKFRLDGPIAEPTEITFKPEDP
jgi:hypothetical protein